MIYIYISGHRRAHYFHDCIYIYIYIYMYIICDIHLFILLINIAPERNEKKKKLGGILVVLLVSITLSLAICEFNYTPF